MYSKEDIALLRSIKPDQLRSLQVPNQDKIIEQIGEPLDLAHAWTLLRSNTQNWEEPPYEARESVKLLSSLLQSLGISLPAKEKESPEAIAQAAEEEEKRRQARYRMAIRAKAKLKALQLQNIL